MENQAVTATLEQKRKKKIKIYFHKKQQLMRLWSRLKRTKRKKNDKFTEVLKTHGFLV